MRHDDLYVPIAIKVSALDLRHAVVVNQRPAKRPVTIQQ